MPKTELQSPLFKKQKLLTFDFQSTKSTKKAVSEKKDYKVSLISFDYINVTYLLILSLEVIFTFNAHENIRKIDKEFRPVWLLGEVTAAYF